MQDNYGCGHSQASGSYCFGPEAPDSYIAIPDQERSTRAQINADACVIDDRYFFLRGCFDIPIVGTKDVFSWLLWVSISEASFDEAMANWQTVGRENLKPCFGWLNTRLPYDVDTVNLKVTLHHRAVGVRPWIEMEPTDHPLAVQQRMGISPADAEHLAQQVEQGNKRQ